MGILDKVKGFIQKDPGGKANNSAMPSSYSQPPKECLQDKVESLSEGATLQLFPQEYAGPLFLRRRLILDGQGTTIWSLKGPTVIVESDGVIMRNFRIEVTGEEGTQGDENCAIFVHPGKGLHPENVEVRGTVIGLPGEEGEWYYPFSLHMGNLAYGSEHHFRMRIYVPVGCHLVSNISGFKLERDQLAPGPHEINLHLDRLPRDTLISGTISIITPLFKRQINVNAHILEASGAIATIQGAGQILYEAPDWTILMAPPEPKPQEVSVKSPTQTESRPSSIPVYPSSHEAVPSSTASAPSGGESHPSGPSVVPLPEPPVQPSPSSIGATPSGEQTVSLPTIPSRPGSTTSPQAPPSPTVSQGPAPPSSQEPPVQPPSTPVSTTPTATPSSGDSKPAPISEPLDRVPGSGPGSLPPTGTKPQVQPPLGPISRPICIKPQPPLNLKDSPFGMSSETIITKDVPIEVSPVDESKPSVISDIFLPPQSCREHESSTVLGETSAPQSHSSSQDVICTDENKLADVVARSQEERPLPPESESQTKTPLKPRKSRIVQLPGISPLFGGDAEKEEKKEGGKS